MPVDLGVQKQKCHPLFHADIMGFQGVTKAVDPLLNLTVGQSTVFTQNSDLGTTPLADVAIHEIIGGVEGLWKFKIVRHVGPPLLLGRFQLNFTGVRLGRRSAVL
jgi:hypothetical protein